MDLFVSMEAFVRAAEAQSFASAARQLGVAKSVITVRVKQLEERFGVSLFHRSTRAVRLSEAGESYYRECVEIVNRIRDLAQRPGLADASPSGMLNVHVLPGFALGHFSDAVIRFRERYPRVEFTVVVNDRVIDPVQEGFDLALQIFPPASDALIERRLFPVRGMLCASPDYVECEPPLHTPSDLLNHDFARYSYYPWGDKWPFMKRDECFEVTLNPVLKTNSVHMLLEFARAGAGVVYLPTMVAAPDLLERRLLRVLPDYAAPPLWLSAVYPSTHRLTTKVKLFVEFIVERYPREPHWDEALLAAVAGDEQT
ncbi:LysR family transcriptional regulator [Paraburkholderia caballeronis]|uniref:DNA-binding transcriptional regulator, LysR family n=1 Tax=Paraburkholderia caballeronis TaxID=416943 RepID=A0A1H7L5C3_9BURK|nr:LysR family transcriptional regulator [Paraburkholderia caballeronis]PXW28290.1 LysR family transcriptional regulator [Paraburkholderia caballeronis]PXX03656.1 LysR family transcriptional regulator [Paraburkholderia caballeronis]RAK04400.1 LysR family transcriptional regulator [Paraburkholderia caballeronis]SED81759.1 transcriptional regulator, LysR family [Paraburkholderia caballeronis]SEK93896.1 DNA-binding transcriptional regulator, LysR family [Paraburkholderia caballeronis]